MTLTPRRGELKFRFRKIRPSDALCHMITRTTTCRTGAVVSRARIRRARPETYVCDLFLPPSVARYTFLTSKKCLWGKKKIENPSVTDKQIQIWHARLRREIHTSTRSARTTTFAPGSTCEIHAHTGLLDDCGVHTASIAGRASSIVGGGCGTFIAPRYFAMALSSTVPRVRPGRRAHTHRVETFLVQHGPSCPGGPRVDNATSCWPPCRCAPDVSGRDFSPRGSRKGQNGSRRDVRSCRIFPSRAVLISTSKGS